MWTRDVTPLPDFPEPYGLLCAILQDATSDWRGELYDVGDPGADVTMWRSRPDGPSIGAVMLHMILAECFWFEKFVLGKELTDDEKKKLLCNEIDVDGGVWPDPPAQPLSWYFDLQDSYRARTLEAVKLWPAADSMIEQGSHNCSPRWVLGHVIQHEAYHGGQIVMLHDLWKRRNDGV